MTQHARVGSIWSKMTSTEHRDVIFLKNEGWRCFGYSWLLLALDILTWHLEMLRISWEGLEELEEGRMEIMGQYFMPGLHRNINPGCHCKNKQGHCLHFIAIFLRLQFSKISWLWKCHVIYLKAGVHATPNGSSTEHWNWSSGNYPWFKIRELHNPVSYTHLTLPTILLV